MNFSVQDTENILTMLRPLLATQAHGHIPLFIRALEQLTVAEPSPFSVTTVDPAMKNFIAVQAGQAPANPQATDDLVQALRSLMPWRKGPFLLSGILIDTEWRSDWKWDRILPFLPSLQGKSVLDIGCGSGYHLFRMIEAGAAAAVGLEPFLLSIVQHLGVWTLCGETRNIVLPLSLEQFTFDSKKFDIAFSMGVIYHRPDPLDHLKRIKDLLHSGGSLVLETLVIDSTEETSLKAPGRYAKMRNIHFLPSIPLVMRWLIESGFIEIRYIGVSKTTVDEQRKTDWMQYESLADFLDPTDLSKTIEGHPAPQRAFFIAKKP